MSATLDSELFCSYFGGAPLINVPGRTFPVAHYFLEDLLDATGHTIEEDSMFALKDVHKSRSTEALWISTQGGEKRREVVEFESQTDSSQVSGNYAGFTIMTQRSMDRVDEKVLNYDLIEDTLLLLCSVDNSCLLTPSGVNPLDGAVLVFLPGMSEIRSMMSRLTGSRLFGDTRRFEVVPLHSSLSPRDQKNAFSIPRRGCRKIILATNIAETSVTIPDVVTVIDCGLVREIRQDKRYATSKLVLDWCSKASIKQRAGRAGRVQEGICCRLFSSRTAKLHMKDQTTPELQRIPLEEVCLNILAGNLSNSCSEFLMQAPQPPPLDSVSLAIRLLHEVGIVQLVDNHETLTVLGQHVAKLPVDVRLAKMLIIGALFKCLDPILTIVGSLSTKSPFAQALHDTGQGKAVHKKFLHESSDFLSLVQLWNVYVTEAKMSKDQGRGFCRRNFVNWTVMMEIRDLRRQNLELLCQIGFVGGTVKVDEVSKSLYNKNGHNEELVHTVVCAGLYPNIAQAVKEHPDDPPSLWHNKERLHFHSSSVNFKKKKLLSDWIVFHEKFATTRTTISATSPIHPLTLILFGGDVVVKHLERKVIVDEWIHLDFAAQTGIKFRTLRRQLDVLLPALIENAESSDVDDMVDSIVQIISK
jgi:HrpA-like RNA helicase